MVLVDTLVSGVHDEVAINPNTVLEAYRELEHKGLGVGRALLFALLLAGATIWLVRRKAAWGRQGTEAARRSM